MKSSKSEKKYIQGFLKYPIAYGTHDDRPGWKVDVYKVFLLYEPGLYPSELSESLEEKNDHTCWFFEMKRLPGEIKIGKCIHFDYIGIRKCLTFEVQRINVKKGGVAFIKLKPIYTVLKPQDFALFIKQNWKRQIF